MFPAHSATATRSWSATGCDCAVCVTTTCPRSRSGIRAYQKAGFTEEGRHRESVLHDGRWYDEVLMSILDHEWVARRSPGR